MVDSAYADMMQADASVPYNHDEYERCSQVLKAALLVFANGDTRYANALWNCLIDSGEEILWYVGRWSHAELMEMEDRY